MVSKEQLFEAISHVKDPEVGFNLVEMGLIYDAEANEEGNCIVTMTLSTKACPMHQLIAQWVKEAAEKVEGINNCEVNVVWEPEWNPTMADEHVKKAMGG